LLDYIASTTLLNEEQTDGEHGQTPQRKTRSAAQPLGRKSLLKMLQDQQYRCALTGEELTPATASLDHKIPLSQGGTSDLDNLEIILLQVNAAKGSMTRDEFIALCRKVVAWQDMCG
jgi:5-methylcytosine-specific restriction endonuclease McrA